MVEPADIDSRDWYCDHCNKRFRSFNAARMHERWCQCKYCANGKYRPVYCGNERWTQEYYCDVHGLFKGYHHNGWYTAKLPPIGCKERAKPQDGWEKIEKHLERLLGKNNDGEEKEDLFAEYLYDKLGKRRDT